VMDERVYLGVDGGGSKTEALVIDGTGRVLGVGYGGPSNYHSIGLDAALDHIRQAATQALAGRSASVAAYCLAGADLPVDFSRLEPALHDLRLSQETVLHNDVIAIFRAGSRQPFGMAVVCGTGFNAGGISRDGREVRLPALGATTGDQAGGEHFGITALGAAFRAWDGRGAQTALQASVLQALHAPSMETLAEWLAHRQVTVQQIADLAPLVFAVALTGDDVACQLIREQGHEIGRERFLRRRYPTDENHPRLCVPDCATGHDQTSGYATRCGGRFACC
jgi:N-acetylglucosamine kinase-like BadF-type ATPase